MFKWSFNIPVDEDNNFEMEKNPMAQYLKNGLLLLVSLFFMLFGIHILITSYRLDDPFSFVISFFASNLIILISATLGLGFAIRLWRQRQDQRTGPHSDSEDP
jgi:hypothetical protein